MNQFTLRVKFTREQKLALMPKPSLSQSHRVRSRCAHEGSDYTHFCPCSPSCSQLISVGRPAAPQLLSPSTEPSNQAAWPNHGGVWRSAHQLRIHCCDSNNGGMDRISGVLKSSTPLYLTVTFTHMCQKSCDCEKLLVVTLEIDLLYRLEFQLEKAYLFILRVIR